jgi:hypothetical protein
MLESNTVNRFTGRARTSGIVSHHLNVIICIWNKSNNHCFRLLGSTKIIQCLRIIQIVVFLGPVSNLRIENTSVTCIQSQRMDFQQSSQKTYSVAQKFPSNLFSSLIHRIPCNSDSSRVVRHRFNICWCNLGHIFSTINGFSPGNGPCTFFVECLHIIQ